MKLENQVCSLDLAKRLKELGVNQESLWWWVEDIASNIHLCYINKADMFHSIKIAKEPLPVNSYSAFTVAELGEMLPDWEEDMIYIFRDCDTWFVQYRKCGFGKAIADFNANTLADAMAKMVIYLKERKL